MAKLKDVVKKALGNDPDRAKELALRAGKDSVKSVTPEGTKGKGDATISHGGI